MIQNSELCIGIYFLVSYINTPFGSVLIHTPLEMLSVFIKLWVFGNDEIQCG